MSSDLAIGSVTSTNRVVPIASSSNKEKFYKTLDVTQKYFASPISFAASGFGALSFITGTIMDAKNELLDKVTTWVCKGGLLSRSIFGALHNAERKNLFATVGYSSDILTSVLASSHSMYVLRAIGSGLDQLPALLTDLMKHPEIINKYNPEHSPSFDFTRFDSFFDSFKKTLFAVKTIFKDIAGDIKENYQTHGLAKALKAVFVARNSANTTVRNLLISTIGLLGSAFAYGILNFDKASIFRDMFGFHADIAVWLKEYSGCEDGQAITEGNAIYGQAGKWYTGGTIADILYRFLPEKLINGDLLALGIDGIGGERMVYANKVDNENTRNAELAMAT